MDNGYSIGNAKGIVTKLNENSLVNPYRIVYYGKLENHKAMIFCEFPLKVNAKQLCSFNISRPCSRT